MLILYLAYKNWVNRTLISTLLETSLEYSIYKEVYQYRPNIQTI
jgi:hypothetical protein